MYANKKTYAPREPDPPILIPDSKYVGRAIEAKLITAKATGIQYVILTFRLDTGHKLKKFLKWGTDPNSALSPEDEEEAGFARDKKTLQLLRTCGWSGRTMEDLNQITEQTCVDVELDVKQNEYKGLVSSSIRWINPLASSAQSRPAKANPDAADRFARLAEEVAPAGDTKPIQAGQHRELHIPFKRVSHANVPSQPARNAAVPYEQARPNPFESSDDDDDIPF